MALLETHGLEKWYGRRQVVNGVSFEVNQGEIVGLLGPNGAGKTTSFRMTIGMVAADGGRVIFDGNDVTKMPMFLRARSGMGYLPQETSIFRQLTVADNLMAILETRPGLSRKECKARMEMLLEQFGLTQIRNTVSMRASGGEKRRLEIARSLIIEPKLMMLDEPFAGIDPKTVIEIQDAIKALANVHGLGVLITDHNIRETLGVTDRSYVIAEGKVFAEGKPKEILANPDVRRVYLGDRFDAGHIGGEDHPPHTARTHITSESPIVDESKLPPINPNTFNIEVFTTDDPDS